MIMVDSSNDFSNLVELNIILSNKMTIRSISHFIYVLKYIYVVIFVFYVFVCST